VTPLRIVVGADNAGFDDKEGRRWLIYTFDDTSASAAKVDLICTYEDAHRHKDRTQDRR
jgi:hypothetical protein